MILKVAVLGGAWIDILLARDNFWLEFRRPQVPCNGV